MKTMVPRSHGCDLKFGPLSTVERVSTPVARMRRGLKGVAFHHPRQYPGRTDAPPSPSWCHSFRSPPAGTSPHGYGDIAEINRLESKPVTVTQPPLVEIRPSSTRSRGRLPDTEPQKPIIGTAYRQTLYVSCQNPWRTGGALEVKKWQLSTGNGNTHNVLRC